MKKMQWILLMGCLISFGAAGQHNVEYNFITKDAPVIAPVESGTNSTFKITNINKFLYEVDIKSSQSEFHSTPPAIFSTIFVFEKKEESTAKAEADKVLEKASETDKKKETAMAFGLEKVKLFSNEKMLTTFSEALMELNNQPDSLKEASKIMQLNQTIQKLNDDIREQKQHIAELTKAIDDDFLKKTTEIQINGRIVSEAFDQLEECKVIKNQLIRIALTDGLDNKTATDKINKLVIDYPFVLRPNKLLSSFQSSYGVFKSALQLYALNATIKEHFKNDEAKLKESTAALAAEIEEIKKKVDRFDYAKLFEEINQLITELQNKNNYFVASDPVQARKDIISYQVKISPRKGVETMTALENRNFTIEVPTKGGVKIDFSTGLFITSNLYNRKYTRSEVPSDTSQSTLTENKNNSLAQLSLGALMHISPRWTGNVKPGFSFGLGLNSEDLSNAQIFIGGSAMFGAAERFIVSAGISLANVDYLNGKYSLNTPIKNTAFSESVTEKSMRAGWFLSLTYNLTNKKKE